MTTNDLPDLDRRAAECLGIRCSGHPHYMHATYRGGSERWHPTQSRDQAALLEAEIEKRGLQANYVGELEARCPLSGGAWMFWLITAPPAARVAAAVEVLEDNRK